MKKIIFIFLTLIFLSPLAYSQKKAEISGRVVYSNSTPVAGVSIFIDNANTGKITDRNGYFNLKVSPEARFLRIFTPSGQLKEMAIDRQNENIFIIEGKKNSDDVISEDETINIGYGTVEKRNMTETVIKLDAEKQNVIYSSIYEMLATQPNVQVNGKRIYIRGVGSINDTQPLFVLDGIVITDIDNIVPVSVKSIEILKGSSASMFGSRGASGVILITLKK